MTLWLIGSGPHAQEYAKVLNALGQEFDVIGRGPSSAQIFQDKTGKRVTSGGINAALAKLPAPESAIVSVSFDQLAATTIALIKAGTRNLLLEKPGGLGVQQINAVAEEADFYGASVWVAYNRRYYASTLEARRIIEADEGVVSCIFEFSEWAHAVKPLHLPREVENAWLIANSSHVIDLAFHLSGNPKEWKSWQSGTLDWHPAARFCGAGITEQNVLFSYHADWQAPGRWSLEILTRKRRLIFRPMEKLQVIPTASIFPEFVELQDSKDEDYKPGLYYETLAFLNGDTQYSCSIQDQLKNSLFYSKIAGYE